MIFEILQNKNLAKKIMIDLAIYSTVLDVLVFFGTLISATLRLDIKQILLPINIGITMVVSAIIFLWFYTKISAIYLNLVSFIKRNFEIKFISVNCFVKGKFTRIRKIYLRFFSAKLSLFI
ncbi:MAG: hypothetical protein QXT34_02870 [Candidatus Aenigmatarchaeota archaeon]